MQINVTYDSSADSAPAAFKTDVQYAVNFLDAAFSNNVTLNIDVGWGEVHGTALLPNDLGESQFAKAPSYTYSQIVGALQAQAAQPDASPDLVAAVQTLSGLPNPTDGGPFDIGLAEAQALGLAPNNPTQLDGWVGFDSNVSDWSFSPTATPAVGQYYLIGTILHEMTEVMGRVSDLGSKGEWYNDAWGVPDLFRFSAPGVRELAPGPAHSTGYFSIDDGQHDLGTWNNHPFRGDLADWDQGTGSGGGPGPGGADSFNNLSNWGVLNQVTNTDLTLMHVLGWEAAQPLNVVMNDEMYYVASGQQSDNNLIIQAGGTVDVADGGTLEGTVTFDGTRALLTIEGWSAPSNIINGFVAGDAIDFLGASIGSHPTVTLLSGNVLEIVEHNHTYDFQFDPSEDFAGQTFHVTGDGFGGTLIYIDPAAQSVTATGAGITNGSGDLNAGHTVTFTLNMNEDVLVDTTNGTPTLSLNDGGIATYSGGSDSNALTFTYTVANGDNTPNLAVTAVNLNGGTIQDINGHNALFNAAINNPPQGNLQIDTTPPQLTGANYSGSSWVFSFSEPVMANGTPTLDLLGRQGSYDANATAALHDPTKVVFDFSSFSPAALPAPGHELTGITDLAGNTPTIDLATAVHADPVFAILFVFTEIAAEYAAGSHAPETANVGSPFHLLV
jgi:hypothetical protein